MMTAFQILIGLVFVVAIVTFGVLLVMNIKASRQIGLASEITLSPDDGAVTKAMIRRAQAFTENGFVEVGAFRIPEMRGVTILALTRTEECSYAIIYRHPNRGVWSELFVQFAPLGSLTLSSAELLPERKRPGHTKRCLRNASEVLQARRNPRRSRACSGKPRWSV